jgi:hypothetical protein
VGGWSLLQIQDVSSKCIRERGSKQGTKYTLEGKTKGTWHSATLSQNLSHYFQNQLAVKHPVEGKYLGKSRDLIVLG